MTASLPPSGEAPSGRSGSERDHRDTAGLLLARLTVLPALLTLPFLLTSFPLLLLGLFKPALVILLWLALTAVMVPFAWRRDSLADGRAAVRHGR